MWIMIAGPYTSGAKTEAERQQNLDRMNRAAYALFRLGHTPIIGVNMALPVIQANGGAEVFDEVMMPLSLALTERCDAVLRIGGPSQGADDEAARFRQADKPVYTALDQIPAP
ncbi:MAG: hypothetical protein ETSY1_04980 [Candidatus Entotheonella factor]|uniref:DUF4406 domain-containing protein n=1 Tax=Entotheonella factor TaxID=1429438 RepID=W4LWB6_ENTF1|nr:hypothetical protein [Candidatus Entotheonella palauensis]ETX02056.1 MAG: hypothetical protein ETSY1_04980 [Candidatus Entotheonella factor]